MAPKKSKGTGSRASSKASVKSKEKRNDPSPVGSVGESGVPNDIFPMVITAATQELFECRVDEDVTKENPFKFLKKDDILQDMKKRAAVSDFHPVKQVAVNYPADELLLVFDRDFTYGQSFYLVLTEEAKERVLNPPESVDEQALEDELESFICKTPEPKSWESLGSHLEIEEESVVDTRPRLKYMISRVRRKFGAPIVFSDRNASDTPGGHMECMPYQDKNFSIQMLERSTGIQAVPDLKSSSTQTAWRYPRNMYTQYEPREFTEEEKENCMNSENLKNFVDLVASRFDIALQQNEIMDVFFDDWRALFQEDVIFGGKTDTHLKEYQSFTDLKYSKEKTISYVNWHPTISGVIAVALAERLSFEERINDSTKLLLNPSLILFWNFSDPLNPQLMLECPDDVFSFEFCPSDPNIIVGGCMNGQVVLWDISAHADRLQGTRAGGGSMSANTNTLPGFEDKHADEIPVMRYCAVSGIESSHKAPITDVQWLPHYFEVSRTGIPLENKNLMCVQILTCAPDCCVMFWDIRAPRAATQSVTDKKHKGEAMPLENPHGVPNTFKHLDLSWKPLIRVNLPKINSTGEYSPLKFSLRDSSENLQASSVDRSHQNVGNSEGKVEYERLRVPSAKQLKVLEDVSTKLYIGMEDGELIYTDWKMEKDNDSGRLFSAKPSRCFVVHDGPVNTVRRSPFFKDILLTVGGWSLAIWKEGVMQGPIMLVSCAAKRGTVGCWSLSRAGVFFIGKEDGNIEVWDLMEKTHEPVQTQNVSTTRITCIEAWIVSSKQHLLAVSDHFGTVHILEIPWALRSAVSKEKLSVGRYFEVEVERLIYFEKQAEMRAKEKMEMDAEELRKKMESVVPETLVEQIAEKAQKEYQDYLALEKVILKDMGLLSEEDKSAEI
ncbi:hypothetical protein COCON_G00060420 [Conger conger]|uniref:WD repeat-containing protein 63 n=1 Tax=Conger conger TaxID=82655 RepID=A0A9Q1I3D3_CONCO|nr:dynein axonemal intermediate chain 3 [Conger conger]KAJ8278976.1 hypothetical protein COCON_G00060420 [Conger conger]